MSTMTPSPEALLRAMLVCHSSGLRLLPIAFAWREGSVRFRLAFLAIHSQAIVRTMVPKLMTLHGFISGKNTVIQTTDDLPLAAAEVDFCWCHHLSRRRMFLY